MNHYLVRLKREQLLLENASNRQVTRSQYNLLSMVIVELFIPKLNIQIEDFIADTSNSNLLINVEQSIKELRADSKLSEPQRRVFDTLINQVRFGVASILKSVGFYQHPFLRSTLILSLSTTIPEPLQNRETKPEPESDDSDSDLYTQKRKRETKKELDDFDSDAIHLIDTDSD